MLQDKVPAISKTYFEYDGTCFDSSRKSHRHRILPLSVRHRLHQKVLEKLAAVAGFLLLGTKNTYVCVITRGWGEKEEKKNNTFDSRMFITSHTRFLRWCFDLRFSFSLPSLRAPPPDPPALPGRPLSR